MHFGIITPPVPGHIHPFGALGRELIGRGHRVTLFQMEDVRAQADAEGLEYVPIGQADHPRGSLPQSLAQLGRLSGLAALRFTIQAVRKTTEMVCLDGPAAIRQAGVEALLVDQTEPAGGTVAEYLKLPFVTVCNALILNRELGVPPPFTAWGYRDTNWARVRNGIGYYAEGKIMSPVSGVVAAYRKKWHLPAHKKPEESFSNLAQISQLFPSFDYPRRELPHTFHYTGPLRSATPSKSAFPWERLDGRRLIYASLGTLQNARENVFRCFAEACSTLDVQLVITHGKGLDEKSAQSLPGDPLVVDYAPQLEVIKRAALTLTHAGLNTVLDSLSCGVPMVAIPITYEQPAIAERLRWTGAGEVIPFAKLTVERLQECLSKVLTKPHYAQNARRGAECIRRAGGAQRAASIVEQVCL